MLESSVSTTFTKVPSRSEQVVPKISRGKPSSSFTLEVYTIFGAKRGYLRHFVCEGFGDVVTMLQDLQEAQESALQSWASGGEAEGDFGDLELLCFGGLHTGACSPEYCRLPGALRAGRCPRCL